MRAKPDMKPWVNIDKSGLSSVGAALTARVLGLLSWGCAAPTGLNKCISMPNPGLAPWAMQEYRPYRAHFSECVVKIGMEEGEYCVDTALLCNGLVFGLGLRAHYECRRHDTPAKPRVK